MLEQRAEKIRVLRPILRRMPHGWLAVSAPGSVIRVGAAGPTQESAHQAFSKELAAWAALAEKPAGKPVG
jgi:hypothetical protein